MGDYETEKDPEIQRLENIIRAHPIGENKTSYQVALSGAQQVAESEILKIIAEVRSWYPVDVFPENVPSLDNKCALMARQTCDNIARLVTERLTLTPNEESPSIAQQAGESENMAMIKGKIERERELRPGVLVQGKIPDLTGCIETTMGELLDAEPVTLTPNQESPPESDQPMSEEEFAKLSPQRQLAFIFWPANQKCGYVNVRAMLRQGFQHGYEECAKRLKLTPDCLTGEALKPNEISTMNLVIEANQKFRERIAELENLISCERANFCSLEAERDKLRAALEQCTYDDCGFDPDAEEKEMLVAAMKNMDSIARAALAETKGDE